ncbi:MAG: helix-turn-helix domain-containing protein [Bacteroidales bacterium]
MSGFLTNGQVEAYKGMHKTASVEKRDRIKAILMLNSGYSQKEIAEVLLLDESTIWRWFNLIRRMAYMPF